MLVFSSEETSGGTKESQRKDINKKAEIDQTRVLSDGTRIVSVVAEAANPFSVDLLCHLLFVISEELSSRETTFGVLAVRARDRGWESR